MPTTIPSPSDEQFAALEARVAALEAGGPDPLPPTDPADLPYWGTPVWRDEFDGDLSGWNVRTRADLGLTICAGEPSADAVKIEDGILHIRGEWLDDAPRPRDTSATGVDVLTHTTGYIDHRNLKPGNVTFAQTYGRWEIRCKTPTGPRTYGSLAAFWLRPDGRPGEIDIMEAWGYGDEPYGDQSYNADSATTTIHTDTSGSGTKVIWTHRVLGGPMPVWDAFHTYAFEYTPTYCAMIVDGVELIRVTPEDDGGTFLWDERYFGTPMHLRVNLHIGPSNDYWGVPDPDHKELTVDPLDYQIEHIRIWAMP